MKLLRYIILKIQWLLSATGATFEAAQDYCDEQYFFSLGKTLSRKIF